MDLLGHNLCARIILLDIAKVLYVEAITTYIHQPCIRMLVASFLIAIMSEIKHLLSLRALYIFNVKSLYLWFSSSLLLFLRF